MRWYVNPRTAVARCLVIAAATIIAVCDSTDPVSLSSADDASPLNIVNVDVYYESLCYDSIQFVKRQLVPTFQQLGGNMNVVYIPYGKATHNKVQDNNGLEKWVFTCQHGTPECSGNKAQACAIEDIMKNSDITNKQQTLVNFVGCVMSARNPSDAVPECLNEIGIDANRRSLVRTCASSAQGDELLAAYGDKTSALRPNLSFVPTIVINGVFSHENQNNALRNLKAVICSYIPHESKPAACQGSN